MPHTLGTLLHPADRERVLSGYVYRMTVESVKRWPIAAKQMRDGGYRLPLITDAEWLATHIFAVRKSDRRLDQRSTCCARLSALSQNRSA